jgi:peroxiredoxin family protein
VDEERDRATIVLFSGDLDRVLAAFNIAVAAASMGMETEIFFTFWGLNVISSGRRVHPPSRPLQRMMQLVNRGGVKRLRLSRLHMMGAGTEAMKRLMKEMRLPSMEEMISLSKDLGVRFIACTTTMGLMGMKREDLLPEVDELAGAATYVEKASRSKVNLFI